MEEVTNIVLSIFNKDLELLNYNLGFSQTSNSRNGRPTGNITADKLFIEIVSDGENDFLEWMLETTQEEDGQISFYAGEALLKTITFSGFLVAYQQNRGNVSDGSNGARKVVTEDLTISTTEINFGDIEYKVAAAA